jgi:hypothetical protein
VSELANNFKPKLMIGSTMGKIKRVTGRGTGIREEEDKPASWAGDSYREYQKKRREELGKDFKLTSGRGTGTKKWTDAPEKPSTKGYTVSTGRGTGKRKLE